MAFIITENCTGCGACPERCPTRAIHGAPDQLHVIDPARCIDCGACGMVCPDEAIHDDQGYLCAEIAPSRRPRAMVDLASCVGCRRCVWSCPFDALTTVHLTADDHFPVAEVRPSACVSCLICELDCPYEAIHVLAPDSVAAATRRDRNAALIARLDATASSRHDEPGGRAA